MLAAECRGSLGRRRLTSRACPDCRRPSRASPRRAAGSSRPRADPRFLVSRNSAGKPANGDSSDEGGGSAISGDGRVVVFFSKAANLPGGDGVGYQVYARDTRSRRTRLASTKANGNPPTASSSAPRSPQTVVSSSSTGPGTGFPAPMARTTRSGGTTAHRRDRSRLKGNSGAPASGGSSYCSVSATGRYVAFSPLCQPPRRRWHQTLRLPARHAPPQDDPAQQDRDGTPAFGTLYGQSVSSSGRSRSSARRMPACPVVTGRPATSTSGICAGAAPS